MKKIDKKKLLSELDKVTTKVAKKIKKDKNKEFILAGKKGDIVTVANYSIKKEGSFFEVWNCDKKKFSGIAIPDIAMSLVNCSMNNKHSTIDLLLDLNNRYIKYKNDLEFYRNSLKHKTKDDTYITYSRIDTAVLHLLSIEDEIDHHKISF